ncbi:MAG TPA: transglycosylase SLT domain-containing protein [Rhodocyclaceae bacterium]|nr:transglycosylase SLT domain-containing protein [Rhodocyclaceae bacterium]
MKFRVLALSLFLVSPVFAQDSRDTAFLIARDAFRAGDYIKLERAAAVVGSGYDLSPYIEYFQLRMNLEQVDPATIRSFLERYDGSYVAEKLRGDWLRMLARKALWVGFEAEYPKLISPEQEVTCLNLQARLARGDKTALDEAQPLWLGLLEPPDACQPVLEALIWEKKVLADDVWARIRRQFEANRTNWAKATMHYLPASQTPDNRQVDAVVDKAMATLVKLPANWAASRLGRELAALAIQRVAANDPRTAAEQLEKLQDRLGDSEKQWAWGEVALNAAKRHMPEALAWYARAGSSPLSDDAHQWKVRAALRAQDWGTVRSAIEAMPARLAALPEWIYWLGRAYKSGGRITQANALFERIAGQPHFYGNLADEELDRFITPPAKAAALTGEELAQASNNAGIRRALAFYRLDLRTEGMKEWNWSLRGMSDRELLAAAELAKRNQIYDRAIAAADRTKNEHDYSLRYLAPYSDQVRPVARNQSLDDAWVYGLMRQESRFITHAKSTVGASGLMQLMPATAKWVAKKLGLKDFHQGKVNDTDTNVLLGTAYMRMVMENLDNQPVLASAAYNAGPGRARKWRADQPLEGAIYAETIPFSETRDYVKKVMSNAVYYSALFNGKPESLKARLGTIGARLSDAIKDADLP